MEYTQTVESRQSHYCAKFGFPIGLKLKRFYEYSVSKHFSLRSYERDLKVYFGNKIDLRNGIIKVLTTERNAFGFESVHSIIFQPDEIDVNIVIRIMPTQAILQTVYPASKDERHKQFFTQLKKSSPYIIIS